MSVVRLTAEWAAWVAALAAPRHHRSAWRLAHVGGGILGSVGRKATVVFALLRDRIDPGGRWLLAIDDPPTKR